MLIGPIVVHDNVVSASGGDVPQECELNIDQEILKHLEWIESIVALLGNEAVGDDEIEAVSQHDRCELGRWLESDESARYREHAEFEQLKQSHKTFHAMAGELISALQSGNENEAVASQKMFIAISQEVIAYLSRLRAHADGEGGSDSA